MKPSEPKSAAKRNHNDVRVALGRSRSGGKIPDFLARLRSIYRGKSLTVSGAELIAQDRRRY
jgi:hypothetical protein